MTNFIKTQFSAGEISPSLWGRVDSNVFQSGASRIRNAYVRPHGSVVNRAGTVYIGQVRDVDEYPQVRLIPFQFSEEDSYVLELTHRMMRVVRNGGYVLSTESVGGVQTLIERRLKNVTNEENATFTTQIAHGFSNGMHVVFAGVADMGELNGRVGVVKTHTTNTFTLETLGGEPFDTTAFGDYQEDESGGRVREIFQKSLPYDGNELAEIRYAQNGDKLTLCHPSHVQQYLTRQDHAVWRLDEAIFEPTLSPPIGLTGKASHLVSSTIDGLTNTNPIIISLDNAQTLFGEGSCGFIRDAVGMQEVNNKVFILGDTTDSALQKYELQNTSLEGINGTDYTPWTSGGIIEGDTLYRYKLTSIAEDGTESRPSETILIASKAMSSLTDADKPYPKIMLTWQAVDGATSYKVYRQREVPSGASEIGGSYGYCGETTATQFVDQNISPDFSRQPPQGYNPFLEPIIQADIFNILRTNPVEVRTSTAHGLNEGDTVKVRACSGMTELNDVSCLVGEVLSGTAVTLKRASDGSDIDATGFKAFGVNISNITQANPAVITTNIDHDFRTGDSVVIEGVAGMTEINGVIGIVVRKTADTITIKSISTGRMINSSSYGAYASGGNVKSYAGYIERRNPANSPIATGYYQQRKVYGGSVENPQTIWLTRTGTEENMDKNASTAESDSLIIKLSSLQLNQIKHIVPLSTLLVLTSGGIYKVSIGGGGETPQAIPQDANGSCDITPLLIGSDIIYVARDKKTLNSIAYTFSSDQYQADDIIIRAKHLFEDYDIIDICAALSPNNLIYAVRADGRILFLTYQKAASVLAWSWGDTGGGEDAFEACCSVSEGGEDVVYTVVRRRIETAGGVKFRKYLERFASRSFLVNENNAPVGNLVFVDSAVSYQGEGNASGSALREVTNLHHLEGREVDVIADGNVLERRVVVDGKITLARPAVNIVVGLPYVTELHTLPIDVGSGETTGKRKRINSVMLRVDKTRGVEISVGHDVWCSIADAPLQATDKLPLLSDDFFIQAAPHHDRKGILYIRQATPQPMEILGVLLNVLVNQL